MNKDIHYDGIAALAVSCGFSPRDAVLIATASQAVDSFRVGNKVPDGFIVDGKKIPILLSQDYSWNAFNDEDIRPLHVWMPFHFFPGVLSGADTWDTIPLPEELTSRIQSYVPIAKRFPYPEERERVLCILGVLLHVYMDTVSHRTYSGRREDSNGDDRKSKLHPGSLVPNIGHAEVPEADSPTAKYKRKGTTLDNLSAFSEGFRKVAELLSEGSIPPIVEARIIPALSSGNLSAAFRKVYQDLTGTDLPKFSIPLNKKWTKEAWKGSTTRLIQGALMIHLCWFFGLLSKRI